jgi:hypothetical protein
MHGAHMHGAHMHGAHMHVHLHLTEGLCPLTQLQ